MEPATSPTGLRDRYAAFIARHEAAWELTMALLALVWVATGFAGGPDDVMPVDLLALEVLLTGIFAVEFFTRLAASRNRRAYIRGHLIDLIALLPPLRGLRMFRLLRLLRLVRAFASFYRALATLERLAGNRGFATVVIVWLTVMVVCSVAVYIAENGINEMIADPFDALWWGVSTITTVGYGETYPVTPEGRIAAMLLMVLGIGLFSAVTATLTSFLAASHEESRPAVPIDLAGQLERIAALRDEGKITEVQFADAFAALVHRSEQR